jgi:hypothetical protein
MFCLTERESDLCEEACLNETEENASNYNRCIELDFETCIDKRYCITRHLHVDVVSYRAREDCETECEGITDGASPDLQGTDLAGCRNRCRSSSEASVGDFMNCMFDLGPLEAVRDAEVQACFDDHLAEDGAASKSEPCFSNADCPDEYRCEAVGDDGAHCLVGERGTGATGDSCEDSHDCTSGACVIGGINGGRCSRDCGADMMCPDGMQCDELDSSGGSGWWCMPL